MKKDKIWTKEFFLVVFSNFVISIGVYMLHPTVPLYLVELGAVESQIGFVVTAFFVTSIFFRLFTNVVLIGKGKKRVLIGATLLNTVVMFSYGLVDSITMVGILRVFQGMSFGATNILTTTMAADFLPDSRRGEGIGYFTMGVVIAMSIGPAISLFLIENIGFYAMFFTASGFSLLATIAVLFSVEPSIAPSGAPEIKGKTAWQNIFDRRLILAAVVSLLVGFSRSAEQSFISVFAQVRALEHLPWYFVIQTATMFCVRSFGGRLQDKKGRNYVVYPGGVAMLASLIILAFTQVSWSMLLAAFFSGVAVGLLAPALQLWMFSFVSPERRNVASATYYNTLEMGLSIGASSLGVLAENTGYTVMFLAAAFVALSSVVAYFTLGREKKLKPE